MIPESPFYLEGQGGLYEFIEQRLKENGHMVIVLAEGAGQEYVAQSMDAISEKDASGNRLLLDVGLWLTQKIKVTIRYGDYFDFFSIFLYFRIKQFFAISNCSFKRLGRFLVFPPIHQPDSFIAFSCPKLFFLCVLKS